VTLSFLVPAGRTDSLGLGGRPLYIASGSRAETGFAGDDGAFYGGGWQCHPLNRSEALTIFYGSRVASRHLNIVEKPVQPPEKKTAWLLHNPLAGNGLRSQQSNQGKPCARFGCMVVAGILSRVYRTAVVPASTEQPI